jgi:hypothetical protein
MASPQDPFRQAVTGKVAAASSLSDKVSVLSEVLEQIIQPQIYKWYSVVKLPKGERKDVSEAYNAALISLDDLVGALLEREQEK